MKVNKYKIIWSILLCTSIVFGQKQTNTINDSFKVNKNVLVEIHSKGADVEVETWNKNRVSIQGVWEIEGLTKEEAEKYFKRWDFEALANDDKVVINLKSTKNDYDEHFDDMDFDFDFDFDMESLAHIGGVFNGNFYSELPPMPVLPPMPPMAALPDIAPPVVEKLKELEFDYNAYLKDKEGYMKKFEKKQQAWEKEFEEKFEPQMKLYEEKMEEWQKKMEPQMKVYEEKINKWQKEMEPKMKEYEKKMQKKLEVLEDEMKIKYEQKIKEKGENASKKYKVTKKLLIKVPVAATLQVDALYGSVTLPDHIKTIK